MRILLFAPIYAIVSFLALQFYSHAIYIFTLRDVYEAFAIYSFFSLLLHYLGRDHAEQQAYLSTKHPHRYPRPCCCIGVFTPADPRFLKRIRIQVMQFVVVKPILTVMAVVMQSLNRFCEESMRPRFGHFWYVTIGLASILTCVYGLITLLHLVQHDIPQHRATAKFWSIKGPIVIILLQSAILSSLNTSDRIPSTPSFSSASMTNAIESLLTCFEMLMVAFFHLYSFSATEYAQPREVEIPLDGVKAPTRPLTPMNAVLRTLNPVDIWVDLRHAFVHRH
ncbi:organic solute transporter subunit alpha/Transmembrane protein [Chytridium lagenaria]|nr:organic solute transporter subunit alpha/Transmembrane protein [Chytridium lagenaria]